MEKRLINKFVDLFCLDDSNEESFYLKFNIGFLRVFFISLEQFYFCEEHTYRKCKNILSYRSRIFIIVVWYEFKSKTVEKFILICVDILR